MQVHLPSHHLNHTTAGENTTIYTSVRPYAGKQDSENSRLVFITTTARSPTCDHNHQHPAIVFSTGGITENPFHEFNEIIIPLFITSRLFRSQIQFNHRRLQSFVKKYYQILSQLSHHEIINPAINSSVHCFSGSVIGLKFHKFLGLNSSDNPQGYYTIPDFKQFLRETYKLKTQRVFQTSNPPVLLLIARRTTRKFLNEAEMVEMMEELGFRVIASSVKKMSELEKFSNVVNSCSVMVGAHGAGLTNEPFYPEGAVLIQIRPLGLEWVSNNYFGEPGHDLGVQYLEYKIAPDEGTLVDV